MKELPPQISALSEFERKRWEKIMTGVQQIDDEFKTLLVRQNQLRKRQAIFIKAMEVFWAHVKDNVRKLEERL